MNVLVFAKQPAPGRVKTRLCPPCSLEQAAAVAAAALADTIDAVSAAPATRRTLVISGCYAAPPQWTVFAQQGAGFGDRLAHAFTATVIPGVPSVLVGMDTPQLTPELLGDVADRLRHGDAVLGPAADGGWWTLALRDPRHAEALRTVAMSTSDTGELTAAALRSRGLTVHTAAPLRDVDTAADAWAVAPACKGPQFAAAVRAHVPAPAPARGRS